VSALDEQALARCEAELHEAARRATGLDDFGEPDYREGLRALLRAWDAEARLSAAGRAALRADAVAILAGRLHSQRGWAQHPDCLQAPLERPLFIVGMPRTGSTALQQLLARDPRHQALELWLARAPRPRPPRARWEADPDFRACDQALRAQYAGRPELDAMHVMAADAPDECWNLMRQSFGSVTFACLAHVPSYLRWWRAWDPRPAYRRYRANLQLIGWRNPRRWLLKDANHLFGLDALLEVFPDALIIQTHRDPVRVIPSVCSLNRGFRQDLSAHLDLRQLGREQLEIWEQGILGALAVRERADPARFVDVQYPELLADPLGVVAGLYARLGLELRASARSRMRDWLQAHPHGGHGAHHYTLEQFGLDPDEIRERFAAYQTRCGVEPERAAAVPRAPAG
jgi:hypothetical protein